MYISILTLFQYRIRICNCVVHFVHTFEIRYVLRLPHERHQLILHWNELVLGIRSLQNEKLYHFDYIFNGCDKILTIYQYESC